MNIPDIIGQTDRILVRSWLDTDINDWMQLSHDEGLNKFSLSGYRMKSLEEARAFTEKAMTFFKSTSLIGAFPIIRRDNSEMIGICGLKLAKLDDEENEQTEIMYRLAQPYWGYGYATEAGEILLEYAFEKLKLSKVIGFILPENYSSRAVLLRLGMSYVRKSTFAVHLIELFEIKNHSATLKNTIFFDDAMIEDIPEIVALLADDQLGSTRELVTEGLDPEYLNAFNEISADPNNELIVGKVGEEIVAVLQITYIPNLTLLGSKRAQIKGVRVSASLRGQGIGKKLFQYALDRARKKGCKLAQLTTNKSRPDAYRFYENLGFKATHEGFKLKL